MTTMDKNPDDIKKIVREKYDQIAADRPDEGTCSCGPSCCGTEEYTIFSDDYSKLQGYVPEADLNLGCGIPTEFANIKTGNTVLDLGSGAGNDCFVARSIVGEGGKVIGIDFSEKMLEKARKNAETLGFDNVEFVESEIEDIDLPDEIIDVVISNCVLNLVPDKAKAFDEIFRVLKSGGHFCVSDVVISGELPDQLKQDAELYAGCVSGALLKEDYMEHMIRAGFVDIDIRAEKNINLPDTLLEKYLTTEELLDYKSSGAGIFSITVTGIKP